MSAPIPQQTATNDEVRAAYEVWRDAPRNDRYAEAVAYQTAARSQNRNDEVCTCGVRWRAHFPVGEAGCDHFETREDEEAAEAASSFTDRLDADIAAHGRPPVTDEQIGRVLASIRAADLPLLTERQIERTEEALRAGQARPDTCPRCAKPIGQNPGCRVCAAYAAAVEAVASWPDDQTAAVLGVDLIQEAQGHIRTALRELVPVQRRLQAEGDTTPANDVEFAMSELALALDALNDAVTR